MFMYLPMKENFNKKCELIRNSVNELRRAREDRGEGSMFNALQPFARPELKTLLGKRIDVLHEFNLDLGNNEKTTENRWCQGEVLEVYDKVKPTVRVLWDPMPDIDGYSETHETDQVLMIGKWRKDVEGAW